jgi:double-stranded uracil-DNA glycosylase
MAPEGTVLPDLIGSGLKIVFCGTAPGTVSARRGAYYAHPQNKFWRILHDVGLTPRLMAPERYGEILQFGLGLTDIAKQASGMDHELPRGALGLAPRAALDAKIRAARPEFLAFTSLAAGRAYLGRAAIFGEQAKQVGETRIWVLPSPSPAAHWNWEAEWWLRLAKAAARESPPD